MRIKTLHFIDQNQNNIKDIIRQPFVHYNIYNDVENNQHWHLNSPPQIISLLFGIPLIPYPKMTQKLTTVKTMVNPNSLKLLGQRQKHEKRKQPYLCPSLVVLLPGQKKKKKSLFSDFSLSLPLQTGNWKGRQSKRHHT